MKQAVEITLAGGQDLATAANPVRCADRSEPKVLSEFGLCFDPAHPLGSTGQALLDSVRPDYLRVSCARPADIRAAAAIGLPLELELLAGRASDDVVAAAAELPDGVVRRFLVRDPDNPVPPPRLLAQVREALGGDRKVGLSTAFLSDLTAYRPDLTRADAVGWMIQPQVHASDDRSLMEIAPATARSSRPRPSSAPGVRPAPRSPWPPPESATGAWMMASPELWLVGSAAALAECTPDAVAMLFVERAGCARARSAAARALRRHPSPRRMPLRAATSSVPATAMCFTTANAESTATARSGTPVPGLREHGESATRHALDPYQVLCTRWQVRPRSQRSSHPPSHRRRARDRTRCIRCAGRAGGCPAETRGSPATTSEWKSDRPSTETAEYSLDQVIHPEAHVVEALPVFGEPDRGRMAGIERLHKLEVGVPEIEVGKPDGHLRRFVDRCHPQAESITEVQQRLLRIGDNDRDVIEPADHRRVYPPSITSRWPVIYPASSEAR